MEFFRTYVAVMQAAGHYVFGSPHGTDLNELRGRDIACWCPLPVEGQPDFCHGAFLKDLANVADPILYMPITEEPE